MAFLPEAKPMREVAKKAKNPGFYSEDNPPFVCDKSPKLKGNPNQAFDVEVRSPYLCHLLISFSLFLQRHFINLHFQ
jgi:hypothetical protein